MSIIKPVFVSKNFISNQQVLFSVYNQNHILITNIFGTEWGNTGTYYVERNVPFNNNNRSYLVIAEEINGVWKSAKLITSKDAF